MMRAIVMAVTAFSATFKRLSTQDPSRGLKRKSSRNPHLTPHFTNNHPIGMPRHLDTGRTQRQGNKGKSTQ